jgi:hypothetical protein
MSNEPYTTEQIHDPQFEELVANISRCPGMWVRPVSFGAVCAYLCGFDNARSGGPLIGLHQWLVVKANCANNFHWVGIVELLIQKEAQEEGQVEEERRIRDLGVLLNEFFSYRRIKGLNKIFSDYGRWLLRRSWYEGPLRRSKAKIVEDNKTPS